jgi:hypothetical protein
VAVSFALMAVPFCGYVAVVAQFTPAVGHAVLEKVACAPDVAEPPPDALTPSPVSHAACPRCTHWRGGADEVITASGRVVDCRCWERAGPRACLPPAHIMEMEATVLLTGLDMSRSGGDGVLADVTSILPRTPASVTAFTLLQSVWAARYRSVTPVAVCEWCACRCDACGGDHGATSWAAEYAQLLQSRLRPADVPSPHSDTEAASFLTGFVSRIEGLLAPASWLWGAGACIACVIPGIPGLAGDAALLLPFGALAAGAASLALIQLQR